MEKLSKNFLWMAAANITGSFFTLLTFIYLARTLGAEAFGRLSYAQTLVFYLANFVDLGFTTYGIREVAKDKNRLSLYVSEIVSFRFLIAIILFAIFCFITYLSSYPYSLKLLMAGTALTFFMSALACEWAFQGTEKMHMVFISFATTTILQLLLVYTFVKGPQDLIKAPVLLFIAALPILITFLRYARFTQMIFKLDLEMIRRYLSSSLIIWSISIFTQVYNGLDIVMLGIFRQAGEVGCYTIARRAVGGVAFLSVFMAGALLPRLAHTFANDIYQFKLATRKFLRISVIFTIFLLLPLITLSKWLITITVGSEYVSASVPLKIMVGALILVLFNLPYSTGLIAIGKEKEVLKQVAASALLSIFLNFILIPKYGMIGASISFLSAEALALSWILYIYHKKVRLGAL